MSVEFFDCPLCSNSVCDTGSYFSCGTCGTSICDRCAKEYKCGYYSDEPPEVNENGEPYDEDSRGCPYCSLEVISNLDLLNYLLDKLKVSRENACEEYRRTKLSDK